jgi:endogenous inhibitor of DNA gyrase (YacG/DUF329 family)
VLCRTEALGGQTWHCSRCDDYHYSYHSCRNRHCPKCGNDRTDHWLEEQKSLLLPVPYFMATITVPEELRSVFRANQKVIYNILFTASAEALQTLALDPKYLGGTIGMIGVLQTWTRNLAYHPHIHFLIPGGGLSYDGNKWIQAKNDFLVHVKPLAILIRAKFRDGCKKAGLHNQIPKSVWKQHWVVHIQAVGTGEAALKYLAPYIHRVAISDRNILSLSDRRVTFRYKDGQTNHFKTSTLNVFEFIRRFLQHVLPKGFVKMRYYGFLATKKRKILIHIRQLLDALMTLPIKMPQQITKSFPCPNCGKPMAFIGELPRRRGPPWFYNRNAYCF